MTPAEQLIEALVSSRPMARRDAVTLTRAVQADALQAAADRMADRHVGLVSSYAITEQLRQDADAVVWGDHLGGAAA
jgi:hypothetical protein